MADERRPERRPFGFVGENQTIHHAREVAGERQGAVLEHRFRPPCLRAAQYFASVRHDLVGGRHLEAGGRDIGTGAIGARRLLRSDAQPPQPRHQPPADPQIAVQHQAGHQRMVGRGDDAVGQLVGVQDRPPAGWPSHDIVAQRGAVGRIDLSAFLVAPQRHARRRPRIEAQRRRDKAGRDRLGDGFVNRHVLCASGLAMAQESPAGYRFQVEG